MVLYDLKVFDAEAHKRLVGADNKVILENYKKLLDYGIRIWVRTPLIGGATDSEENILATAKFIASVGQPERWELCTFNNLCKDKYERLDLEWEYKNNERIKKAYAERLVEIAKPFVPSVTYSGVTVD
jgi:pyruvate formate lyase activating enzyme